MYEGNDYMESFLRATNFDTEPSDSIAQESKQLCTKMKMVCFCGTCSHHASSKCHNSHPTPGLCGAWGGALASRVKMRTWAPVNKKQNRAQPRSRGWPQRPSRRGPMETHRDHRDACRAGLGERHVAEGTDHHLPRWCPWDPNFRWLSVMNVGALSDSQHPLSPLLIFTSLYMVGSHPFNPVELIPLPAQTSLR